MIHFVICKYLYAELIGQTYHDILHAIGKQKPVTVCSRFDLRNRIENNVFCTDVLASCRRTRFAAFHIYSLGKTLRQFHHTICSFELCVGGGGGGGGGRGTKLFHYTGHLIVMKQS